MPPSISEVEAFRAPPPPKDGRLIGLDCHPDIFSLAVIEGQTPHDARVLSTRENLSLEALLQWASNHSTQADLFVLEAGVNSFSVCDALLARGLRAIVVESAHVGRQAKFYADNDRLAAIRIARVFLQGNAPCFWRPDPQTRTRRELLHIYSRTVVEHTAAVNAYKSFLSGHSIRLQKRKVDDPKTLAWVLQARAWSSLETKILQGYGAAITHAASQRRHFLALMAEEIAQEPAMLRCMKILGIGRVNAFALLALIGTIRRFENPRKLVAYIGLNPGIRSSGKNKHLKIGVGVRGRADLRQFLVQSAHAVLRMGKNSALGQWGWKLFARKGHRNVAVVAVARKLAVQVWHVLSGNPPTMLEKDKSVMRKFSLLATFLGKERRAALALGATNDECVETLRARAEQVIDFRPPAPEPV